MSRDSLLWYSTLMKLRMVTSSVMSLCFGLLWWVETSQANWTLLAVAVLSLVADHLIDSRADRILKAELAALEREVCP